MKRTGLTREEKNAQVYKREVVAPQVENIVVEETIEVIETEVVAEKPARKLRVKKVIDEEIINPEN